MSMNPQLLGQILMGQQPMSGAPGPQGGLTPSNSVPGAAANAVQQVARARMLQQLLQNRGQQQPQQGMPQQPPGQVPPVPTMNTQGSGAINPSFPYFPQR